SQSVQPLRLPMPPAPAPVPALPEPALAFPWLHAPPPGLSKGERRRWIRDQRKNTRNFALHAIANRPEPTSDQKVARFRRNFASYLGVTGLIFGVNVATGFGYPW